MRTGVSVKSRARSGYYPLAKIKIKIKIKTISMIGCDQERAKTHTESSGLCDIRYRVGSPREGDSVNQRGAEADSEIEFLSFLK